jgi:DNA (cytosine-5)-methyltransferase 1
MILNGADYGCPQNRERVFMFSVLGESNETVKEKMLGVLDLKEERVPMKCYIEEEVDDKLFITPPYELNDSKVKSVCKLIARRSDIKYDQTRRIYSTEACSPCLTTSGSPQIMLEDKRIRTLTAREGYRFMGVKDEDIDKLLTTKLSTNQHIALAGNSICVPVMSAIFQQFFVEYQ